MSRCCIYATAIHAIQLLKRHRCHLLSKKIRIVMIYPQKMFRKDVVSPEEGDNAMTERGKQAPAGRDQVATNAPVSPYILLAKRPLVRGRDFVLVPAARMGISAG